MPNNENDNRPNINITSHNQMGGVTAHTVQIGKVQRVLGDVLKNQILSQLPRDKPITVLGVMGDPESCILAESIHAFLKSNNFPLAEQDGISQAVFMPMAKGLIVKPLEDRIEFIVGSNS
jgi:hypothetical protein